MLVKSKYDVYLKKGLRKWINDLIDTERHEDSQLGLEIISAILQACKDLNLDYQT